MKTGLTPPLQRVNPDSERADIFASATWFAHPKVQRLSSGVRPSAMAEVQAVVEHVSDRTRPDRRLEHMVTNDITYLDKPGVFVIDPQYGAEEQRARLKHLFTQRLSPLLQAAQLIQGRAPDAWRRLKA